VKVPALNISGWYDIFLWGTYQNYQGMRKRGGTPQARQNQRLVIGPWSHSNLSGSFPEREFGAAAELVEDMVVVHTALAEAGRHSEESENRNAVGDCRMVAAHTAQGTWEAGYSCLAVAGTQVVAMAHPVVVVTCSFPLFLCGTTPGATIAYA
jgi:predicted acyl esterase